MVFGLVLTPNKKYSQTVEKDYTLTNAALDTKTSGAGDTQLMVTVEKNTFLLCTLNKQNPQCTLDLQVSEGETIGFCSTGTGTIHLVGYMLPDDPMGVDYEGGEESMSDEEDEETEVPQLVPIKGAKKQQKGKPAAQEEESDDDDDDDDDEEDDDDDSELGEEEEGDDDDDDDDDEEEDDSEDEKPQPQKKAKLDVKQNGLENGVPQQKSKKELKKQKKQEAQQQKKDKQDGQQKPQQQQQKTGKKQVLQGGVTIEDLKVGDGPEAKSNKKVAVYYEGRLKSNNKVFDSCKSGNGFKFTIGRGEVIRGWEVGVAGMKVGSKRRIICPPQMAYGAKGSPPVIPPNSTLVFDVELRHIKN